MPVCGRLGGWSVWVDGCLLRFAATPCRSGRAQVDFVALLSRLLPVWTVEALEDGRIAGVAPADAVGSCESIETALYLLETSVVIEDAADVSHALRIHDARDEHGAGWAHSDIGKLVKAAKSYDLGSGDRRKAEQLASEMFYWVEAMPLYRDADVIAPAPSSNPNKAFDLPAFIADCLSARMSRPRAEIRSSNAVPQKNLGEREKASADELARHYSVVGDVGGRTVLVIDDIYESGATVGAMTKVLRDAGAAAVLSLTATKTAKGCQGLRPSTDNWPMEA